MCGGSVQVAKCVEIGLPQLVLLVIVSQVCPLLLQFNDIVNVIFSSEALVAGVVAYFLDNTLQLHESSTRKDRGYHFWDKFRTFKKDPRSEEFYSLPFKLNRFFTPD
ncbi:hypothetical protein BHM03_00023013 [Ensete ventricosum]|nr:hypothetical protein BHM03_00023013 [Ensete ventricosum]